MSKPTKDETFLALTRFFASVNGRDERDHEMSPQLVENLHEQIDAVQDPHARTVLRYLLIEMAHTEKAWRAAYADALSALRYIRFRWGKLEGVGWRRIENTAATMMGASSAETGTL